MKNLILTSFSIILPMVYAILGWVIHRKTERIKIMENQLSDKKYKAYADIVSLFFNILKDTKSQKKTNTRDIMLRMIDSKRDIFMYGSDEVFHAFNEYLITSSKAPNAPKVIMNAFLQFILTIRQDMCGKHSKINQMDILINLLQDEDEIRRFYSF